MWGTIVNALAIVAGAVLGKLFGSRVADNIKETLMQAIGLGVILVGVQMSLETNNVLIMIISLVLGGITGELLHIEWHLENIGKLLEKTIAKTGRKENNSFVKGFVTASLIYVVGAMAIMGALEAGLTGHYKILFTKSILDGVMSVLLASTLGLGVAFSAVPVFLYQGSITLLANWVGTFLNDMVISEMTATGGILILAIGLGILNIKKINVGNLLPSIFYSFLLAMVFLTN